MWPMAASVQATVVDALATADAARLFVQAVAAECPGLCGRLVVGVSGNGEVQEAMQAGARGARRVGDQVQRLDMTPDEAVRPRLNSSPSLLCPIDSTRAFESTDSITDKGRTSRWDRLTARSRSPRRLWPRTTVRQNQGDAPRIR